MFIGLSLAGQTSDFFLPINFNFKNLYMIHLTQKTAFITGGTKGIGFGIAQALLSQGVSVAFTGRHKAGVAQAQELLKHHCHDSDVKGYKADVGVFDDLDRAARSAVKDFGGVDLVIANAGVGHFAPVHELSLDQWHETINTNLTGVFYTLKVLAQQLIQHRGYFISISSLAGTNFFGSGSAYNASKFGVTGFTQAAMLDLRQFGVKMTTIMPGSVATYFNNHTPDDSDFWKIQQEDIGQMVVDLIKMPPRTLPSKIEVRPTVPGGLK